MASKRKAPNLNKDIDASLSKAGIPHTEREIYRVNPGRFLKAIKKGKKANKSGWMVDVHTKAEYAKMKCYLTADGQSGICVTKDGDVVSLFSRSKEKNAMGKLIPFAVAHGGRKLDCYANGLQNMYARYGAKAIAQTPFNVDYAPDDWDGTSTNPVVAMTLPSSIAEIIRVYDGDARADISKAKEFADKENGYGQMKAYRDKKMSQKTSGVNGMALSAT